LCKEKRILKHVLLSILNVKYGLEDNIFYIQQIPQVHVIDGVNIKDILLSSTNDQIVSINTVCQLGSAWLNEDVDLNISFLETQEAGLSFF